MNRKKFDELTLRIEELEARLEDRGGLNGEKAVRLSRARDGQITHINGRPVLRDQNNLIVGIE